MVPAGTWGKMALLYALTLQKYFLQLVSKQIRTISLILHQGKLRKRMKKYLPVVKKKIKFGKPRNPPIEHIRREGNQS